MTDLFEYLEEVTAANCTGPTNGTLTSWLAALENGKRNGGQRERLLHAYADVADATDEEMQHRLRMNPNTQRPRRGELADLLLVERVKDEAGEPVRRNTVFGCAADVWRITETGRRLVARRRAMTATTDPVGAPGLLPVPVHAGSVVGALEAQT
jgi:hypothetical protein